MSEILRNKLAHAKIQEAVIAIDDVGWVIDLDESAQQMLRYSREAVVGRPVKELIVPMQERKDSKHGIIAYLQSAERPSLACFTANLLGGDDQIFQASIKISRISATRHTPRWLYILRFYKHDTTSIASNLFANNAPLRSDSQHYDDTRLHEAFHDLKSYFRMIQLHSEILISSLIPQHSPPYFQARNILQVAKEGLKDIARMYNQPAVGSEAEPGIFSVNSIITLQSPLYKHLLQPDIAFQVKLEPMLDFIRGVPWKILCLVYELIANAKSSIAYAGAVMIETKNVRFLELNGIEIGPHILLQITDTGCGMPPELVEHALNPNRQNEASLIDSRGLGFYVISNILESHGAHLEICSEVHHGTICKIYFPVAKRQSGSGASPSQLHARKTNRT